MYYKNMHNWLQYPYHHHAVSTIQIEYTFAAVVVDAQMQSAVQIESQNPCTRSDKPASGQPAFQYYIERRSQHEIDVFCVRSARSMSVNSLLLIFPLTEKPFFNKRASAVEVVAS